MRTLTLLAVALGLALSARAADDPEAALGHMVYFTLKDNSPEAKKKIIESCKKLLDKHEGTIHFSVGVVSEDLKGEFNVRDWDVALHLVFKNKAAHDKYQVHERHKKFIEENKDNLKNIRVFDATVK